MVFIFWQGLTRWVLLGLLWTAFVVFCAYYKCYKIRFPCWFCIVSFSYSISQLCFMWDFASCVISTIFCYLGSCDIWGLFKPIVWPVWFVTISRAKAIEWYVVKLNLNLCCLSIDVLLLKKVDGAVASRFHHCQVLSHWNLAMQPSHFLVSRFHF